MVLLENQVGSRYRPFSGDNWTDHDYRSRSNARPTRAKAKCRRCSITSIRGTSVDRTPHFARRSHSYRLKNSKVAKDTGVIESSGYDLASAPIGPCAGRKTPRS